MKDQADDLNTYKGHTLKEYELVEEDIKKPKKETKEAPKKAGRPKKTEETKED